MPKRVPGAARAAPAGTVADIVRRHDPDAFTRSLARRSDQDLPFEIATMPPHLPVMLDTNVYIQRLRRRLPAGLLAFVEDRPVLHSGVSCAELAISAGILDPTHSGTAENRGAIMGVLQAISDTDIVQPSAAAWAEAGMIAGILARTQHLSKTQEEFVPRRGLLPGRVAAQAHQRRPAVPERLRARSHPRVDEQQGHGPAAAVPPRGARLAVQASRSALSLSGPGRLSRPASK